MSDTEAGDTDREATTQPEGGTLQAHTTAADEDAGPTGEEAARPPQATGRATTEDTLGVTLSTRFQSAPVVVATDHTPATVRIHQDHEHIRLEAIEATDRTVEAVLRGSPTAMTALADRLYAAARVATTDSGGEDDG